MRDNLRSRPTWQRLLYMLACALALGVAQTILAAIVVFQFLSSLFTGNVNTNLRDFGQALSRYGYALMRYLTYNTEVPPWPFSDWEGLGDEAG